MLDGPGESLGDLAFFGRLSLAKSCPSLVFRGLDPPKGGDDAREEKKGGVLKGLTMRKPTQVPGN